MQSFEKFAGVTCPAITAYPTPNFFSSLSSLPTCPTFTELVYHQKWIQLISVRFHRLVQSSEVVCLRFSLFWRVKQGSSPDPQSRQAADWYQNRREGKRT